MIKLDKVDIQILNIIQKNSKMTIKEIANQLNLSTTPIFERLKKLENEKVIQSFVALLDAKKLGKKMTAFIHISIIDHSHKGLDEFVQQVVDYPEVMECHHVTGDSDFLLKILVEDIEKYNQFLTEKLSKVKNISKIKSSFSLSTKKATTAFEINLNAIPKI